MFKRFRSTLRAFLSRRHFEANMADELRFHIDQYADDLMCSGLSKTEARRRARLEFGGLNTVKGDCRGARGLAIFDEISREVQYAARRLRRTPGFTVTALLTLAVCLGANVTIFAAIDTILLRSLPFPAPDRLVTIFNTYPKAGVERDGASRTNYYERRGHIPAFSSLAIYRDGTAITGQPGSTEREPISRVSPDFFSTLKVTLAMGRAFTEEETTDKTDDVTIITDAYWRRRFNADPHVLGRRILVDTFPKTVIGVLPPGFRFLSSHTRLYIPLSSRPQDRLPSERHSGGNAIQMIARLKPGISISQAQAQIDAQNATLELDDPSAKAMADAGFRSLVVSLHGDHIAAVRPTLLLLEAGVLVLLLIGTVNLTNLLLIRASSRAKEQAIRQALGASSLSVVSEVVVETTLLTLLGGLLGLAVGAGGIRLLELLGADRLPLGSQIAFDARLACLALIAATGLGCALAAPIAWIGVRLDLSGSLQSEGRGGTASRSTQAWRYGFIVAQIALAFVLLWGAGLLGISLRHAAAVSPGFEASHVLTGQISLIGNKYPEPLTGLTFTERLIAELAHQPGIGAAGVVNNIPFSGQNGKSAAQVKGRVLRPGESPRGHYSYGVGGNYFGALGFTLRAGRFLTAEDSRRPERVCVVDEDFARYYWPDTSPLGQHLFQGSSPGNDSEAFTVVGVVGSVKQAALTEDTAQGAVYYPYIYRPENKIFVVVRASLSSPSLKLVLQKVVRNIDPDLAVNDLQMVDERIDDSLVVRRSPALLAGIFSVLALLLTLIGTYGVLSYGVARRRREIAVRMALGAAPGQIRSQYLALGFRLLTAGLVLGLGLAWMTGRAMQATLFHQSAFDPAILAATIGVIAAVSLVACLLPSHRAARISPMQALADK